MTRMLLLSVLVGLGAPVAALATEEVYTVFLESPVTNRHYASQTQIKGYIDYGFWNDSIKRVRYKTEHTVTKEGGTSAVC